MKGLRILIVDDNETNRNLLATMFQTWGAENVDTAENGREAVEMIKNKNYDLVLMDMQIPEMDGIEATKKIRKESKLPIIALTGAALMEDKEKCLQAGMDEYITKPVSHSDLMRIMKQMIPELGENVKVFQSVQMALVEDEGMLLDNTLDLDDFKNRMKGLDIFSLMIYLLPGFINSLVTNTNAMRKEFDENDYVGVHDLAHNIKGSAGNISAIEICEIATKINELTKNLKDNWKKEVGPLIDQLEKASNIFSFASIMIILRSISEEVIKGGDFDLEKIKLVLGPWVGLLSAQFEGEEI